MKRNDWTEDLRGGEVAEADHRRSRRTRVILEFRMEEGSFSDNNTVHTTNWMASGLWGGCGVDFLSTSDNLSKVCGRDI